MPRKQLPNQIVRPAAHGSKKDWVPVTGDVPPETRDRLDLLAQQRPAFRTDLVREAIELLLSRDLAA
jgi:hypothetical protein